MITVVPCEDFGEQIFRPSEIRYSVTAVGGTDFIPEVAVSVFFSGGGFSDYVCGRLVSDDFTFNLSHQFSRPKYQDEVVTQYLNALPNGTYVGLFNQYVSIHFLTILTEHPLENHHRSGRVRPSSS